jgi:hypothetical protein
LFAYLRRYLFTRCVVSSCPGRASQETSFFGMCSAPLFFAWNPGLLRLLHSDVLTTLLDFVHLVQNTLYLKANFLFFFSGGAINKLCRQPITPWLIGNFVIKIVFIVLAKRVGFVPDPGSQRISADPDPHPAYCPLARFSLEGLSRMHIFVCRVADSSWRASL